MESLTRSPERDVSTKEQRSSSALPHIVIYGASGHALGCALDLKHRLRSRPLCEIVAYIDDFRGGRGELLDGAPIISFEEWRSRFGNVSCFISVGDPSARRRLAEKMQACGGSFSRLFESEETALPHVKMGVGSAVAATSHVGPQTTLGDHVHIYPMSWVAHDVRIADYVTVAASCSVSGHVVIEEGVFVGAGAVIVHGRPDRPLVIGAGAKIAAGAVVTKSIPPGATVAGNPARPLRELARNRTASHDAE